jgi:diguanylate cyclase (GGDEF)-like protein
MTATAVTLASVEAFMNERRAHSIGFPLPIERRFESDMQSKRCKRLIVGLLVSAPLYNLFLLADWLLVPDVMRMVTWLHFGIVTPWMLLAAALISRKPAPFVRECLATSVPLLIIWQIDLGFASTTNPNAAHYQYVVVPLLLYTNVSILRLKFHFARAVTAVILLLHSALVLWASYIPAPVAATIIVEIVVTAYITLVANYTMERDLRRSYLYSLRDRLRHAEADAASRRDPLTGLANRFHLDAELARLWSLPEFKGSPVSIIMVDIDYFKRLNDRYGHGGGDTCLKRVAAILQAELQRTGELAVRYGGEEFLLLLPNVEMIDAVRLAERIRRAIESACIPNEGSGARGMVTASFGAATSSTSDLSALELIAAADQSLYAAKSKGRNQVWPPFAANVSVRSPTLLMECAAGARQDGI